MPFNMKSLQLLLLTLPQLYTANFLDLLNPKYQSLSKKQQTFAQLNTSSVQLQRQVFNAKFQGATNQIIKSHSNTPNISVTLPHQITLPEFGREKNIYSRQDKNQVNKNKEELKHAKIIQEAGLLTNSSNPAILKAAFAPGPTEFYDYKKEIWFNFRYKDINLVASGLVYSSDRVPPHCEVYQPDVNWGKRDFSNICMKLRKSLPDVRTLCQTLDMDRNGGTCRNYNALLSFENSGKPDVWLNRNTFDYNASNDPKQDCHLYTYHEYSTVVYACKNPVLVSSKPTQYNHDQEDANLDQGLSLNLLSNIANGVSLKKEETMEALRTKNWDSKLGINVNQNGQFSRHKLVSHNSIDMLRMMLTHTGRKHLVEKVLNHGCWCPFVRDPFSGLSGKPLDEFDTMCRNHRECLKCGSYPPNNCGKDFSTETNSNYTIVYDNEDGVWSCDSDSNNFCQNSRCECDLDFALNVNDQITVVGEWSSKNMLKEVADEDCPKTGLLSDHAILALNAGGDSGDFGRNDQYSSHSTDFGYMPNIQAGVELMPGEIYSPRGPAQAGIPMRIAEPVEIKLSNDDEEHSQNRRINPAKFGTDLYKTGGRGGRKIKDKTSGKVQHMCCGSAPNWKVFNKATHQCTNDGYVLFGGPQ